MAELNYWAFQIDSEGNILNYTSPRFAVGMDDGSWIKVPNVDGFKISEMDNWKVTDGMLVSKSGSTSSSDSSEIEELKSQVNNLTFEIMKLTNASTTES